MSPMRIKIKELDLYNGTQDAKLLGNYCWDIEKYLEKMKKCLDKVKVHVAAMILKGTAKLWWGK